MRRVRLGNAPVRVPRTVLDGIDRVRESGLTNMLDRPRVAHLAEFFGYEESAAWIRVHRGEYATGLFHGFEAAEGERSS